MPLLRASRKRSREGWTRKESVGVVPYKKRVEEYIKPKWIKTGILGFDDLIEKGIPEGTNILVAGGPGTGKTIFCLQTLYNAVRGGKDCLYVTFEELPMRLVQHMKEFGWSFELVERKDIDPGDLVVAAGEAGKCGTLVIRRLNPFKIARSVEALLVKATSRLPISVKGVPELTSKALKPYLVTLDSITALESAFVGRPESYRIYIEQLFRFLEEIGATTFLITETEEAPTKYSKTGVEEFLADGVFVLYYFKSKDMRTRAIEVLKLRGAKHVSKIVPFRIINQGIEVLSSELLYEIE